MSWMKYHKWEEGETIFRLVPPRSHEPGSIDAQLHFNKEVRRFVRCDRDHGKCYYCIDGDRRILKNYFNIELWDRRGEAKIVSFSLRVWAVFNQTLLTWDSAHATGKTSIWEHLIHVHRTGDKFPKYEFLVGKWVGHISPEVIRTQPDLTSIPFYGGSTPIERAARIIEKELSE